MLGSVGCLLKRQQFQENITVNTHSTYSLTSVVGWLCKQERQNLIADTKVSGSMDGWSGWMFI